MHAAGIGLGLPAQDVNERARGIRSRHPGRDRGGRLHHDAAGRRAAGEHDGHQVADRFRVAQDRVREADVERLFESGEQLDPLEAADAQIPVEHVVERHAAAHRCGAQLGHEGVDEHEDAMLNRRQLDGRGASARFQADLPATSGFRFAVVPEQEARRAWQCRIQRIFGVPDAPTRPAPGEFAPHWGIEVRLTPPATR